MVDENLYLFTGTAEIFIQNRISRIISSYDKQQVSIIKYDMEQTSFSRVLEDACTLPFLEDLKIIILRNPTFLTTKGEIANDAKNFIKYLKKPVETSIIIINATNITPNPSNEVYKALKNYAMIIDYSDSEEIEIKGWITRTAAARGIEIKDSAINLFLEYINSDQVRMVNELDKIMNYVGDGGIINEEVVKLLVTRDLSKEIFNLIKAIIAKDLIKTNKIYQTLALQTKDIQGVIAMISNSFKDLLTTAKLLKAGYSQHDISRFYNVSSSRAYYIVKDAKNFKVEDLEKYIIKMADLDYKIKSGKIDKNIGIELILLQLND
ncbi:MAG: DNA polymerase III subunit delta [Bacilli bacterium]|jgi:DNA polymerase-3 subunit delta|nr:DNA polymerase III subunit delta [Bacilli bacterium]